MQNFICFRTTFCHKGMIAFRKHCMKIPFSLLIVLLAVGATFAIDSLARSSNDRDSQRIRDLQAAADAQLDILSPFLAKHHLGCGASTQTDNFRTFLHEQITSGKLSVEEADQVLASILAAGQGEPVHTQRGWIMPIIADH